MKVRFALEHILVAFLYAKRANLPDFYIEDHQEGHFESEEGFPKRKSTKRMVNELAALIETVRSAHPEFLQTFREIKIIERNARLYLQRPDGATLFSNHDSLEHRGAIRKIYSEFVRLVSPREDNGLPQS